MTWRNFRHIAKLDPDKELSDEAIEKIINSGTDAIMISGTLGITKENVSQLIARLKKYNIPKILEPVNPDAVVYDGMDYVFVPRVFNTKNLEWTGKRHLEWIKKQAKEIKKFKPKIIPETYIILNPNAAVAKVTEANTKLNIDEIVSCALAAEYLGAPIIYLEYSGAYGTPEVVGAVSTALKKSKLFYGGGIDSKAKAEEMSKYADTIIVGNAYYENLEGALETVI